MKLDNGGMAKVFFVIGIAILSAGFLYSRFTNAVDAFNASLWGSVAGVCFGTSFTMLIGLGPRKPKRDAKVSPRKDETMLALAMLGLALGWCLLTAKKKKPG